MLFSAFAIADFNNFSKTSLPAFGVNFNIANASSTFFPLIKLATIATFLLEILAYFTVAFVDNSSTSATFSAFFSTFTVSFAL